MAWDYFFYEIVIQARTDEYFQKYFESLIIDLVMNFYISTLYKDEINEVWFHGWEIVIQDLPNIDEIKILSFLTKLYLSPSDNHLEVSDYDDSVELFQITFIQLDESRYLLKLEPNLILSECLKWDYKDGIRINDEMVIETIYPYIEFFMQSITQNYEIIRCEKKYYDKNETENYESKDLKIKNAGRPLEEKKTIDETNVSREINLKLKPAGRKRNPNHDKAFEFFLDNNSWEEVYKYWCNLENVTPSKTENKRFKRAMKYRMKDLKKGTK